MQGTELGLHGEGREKHKYSNRNAFSFPKEFII